MSRILDGGPLCLQRPSRMCSSCSLERSVSAALPGC